MLPQYTAAAKFRAVLYDKETGVYSTPVRLSKTQALKGRVRETAGFPNGIGQGGVYAAARKIGI
jgi:hypothetical protein